jgi:cob(I)alamin adenosyltransferase
MVRIDKVYTRGGDQGETSLVGGDRVSKSSLRIDCYGTVDELNAVLGLIRTALEQSPAAGELIPLVSRLQNELFDLGAELATPDADRRAKAPHITQPAVDALEQDIDRLNATLAPLKSFILPGGGWVSSYFHLARTVCRRAERLVVALAGSEEIGELPVRYLNRLSDALFVFGRWSAAKDGQAEPLWETRRS